MTNRWQTDLSGPEWWPRRYQSQQNPSKISSYCQPNLSSFSFHCNLSWFSSNMLWKTKKWQKNKKVQSAIPIMKFRRKKCKYIFYLWLTLNYYFHLKKFMSSISVTDEKAVWNKRIFWGIKGSILVWWDYHKQYDINYTESLGHSQGLFGKEIRTGSFLEHTNCNTTDFLLIASLFYKSTLFIALM